MHHLTCGHTADTIEEAFLTNLMGYTEDGSPCINYDVYCEFCYTRAYEQGLVALSEEQENDWLRQEF